MGERSDDTVPDQGPHRGPNRRRNPGSDLGRDADRDATRQVGPGAGRPDARKSVAPVPEGVAESGAGSTSERASRSAPVPGSGSGQDTRVPSVGTLRSVRVYARPSRLMARQVGGDVLLLVWGIVWFLVARVVKHMVDALATPTQQLAAAAQQVSDSAGSAGQQVQRVPGVGSTIAEPFQVLHDQVAGLSGAATRQIAGIHHVAWVLAVVTFAIPVAVACWRWLPGRIAFAREATATRRLVDSVADLDLFALRAMANLPMSALARVSDDPVGDWREGNREVIQELARLELRRAGLSLPASRR